MAEPATAIEQKLESKKFVAGLVRSKEDYWVLAAICLFPFFGIVFESAVGVRALLLDARVYRFMTSAPSLTVEEVQQGLRADLRGTRASVRPWDLKDTSPHLGLSFSNDERRWLYLEYDSQTRAVTRWFMVGLVSEEIDAEMATKPSPYLKLLLLSMCSGMVAMMPMVLWWLFNHTRPLGARILIGTTLIFSLLLDVVIDFFCWGRILIFGII